MYFTLLIILGISAFYHDSATAIVVDGQIVAAAQEERFTRIKHDPDFPKHALEYCLEEANTTIDQVDYIVFYEKPLLKFERLIETYLSYWPFGFTSFRRFLSTWLKQKLFLGREIKKELGDSFSGKIIYTKHHESHSASAFFPSPFEESAILTIDGVGEWDTTTIGYGNGNKINLLKSITFPHSLGLLYSAVTYYCGFRVNSGEYKLMGLAPYGNPVYYDKLKSLIQVRDDGSFWLDMSYFTYANGLKMTGKKFEKLLGKPRRQAESDIEVFYMDVASSIQKIIEEVVIKLATHAKQLTNSDNLTLAGGVALNCVANGKIVKENIFKNIWIQPAAGDAGGAIGSALFSWYQLLENKRTLSHDTQSGSYLGEESSKNEIQNLLDEKNVIYEYYESDEELANQVADHIINQEVVGLHQGRMEFGPRALGARSIIADPRSSDMQSKVNLKIKYRESFRPFAPAILEEHASDYFNLPSDVNSPHMLLVAPVNDEIRVDCKDSLEAKDGIGKLSIKRSTLPAVTHVDFSARIQTVDKDQGMFRKVLESFYQKTGCPVLINTSFNIRGEPIVRTPKDSLHCFLNTEMDTLVVENFVIRKKNQTVSVESDESYQDNFLLD